MALARRFGDTSVLLQSSDKKGDETKTNGSSDVTGSARTVANPADDKNTNLLFKLHHDLEGGHRIGLTAERFSTDKDTDEKSSYSSTYSSYDHHTEATRQRLSLDYTYEAIADDALIQNARASLYYQKLQKEDGTFAYRTTSPVGDYGRTSDTEEGTFGLHRRRHRPLRYRLLRHEVTLGTDMSIFSTQQYIAGVDNCATDYSFGCNDNLGGRITGFYNRYRNFIDTDLVPEAGYAYGTYRYDNRDRVKIYGVEARAHKAFDNGFDLRASLAYARGVDMDTGEVLSSVASLKAIVGIGYSRENWDAGLDWIEGRFRQVHRKLQGSGLRPRQPDRLVGTRRL